MPAFGCGLNHWMQQIDKTVPPVFVVYDLSWLFVESSGNSVQLGLQLSRQVDTFGEILAVQSVRTFVRSALPMELRITEINLDVRDRHEVLVVDQFFSRLQAHVQCDLHRISA